MGSVGGEVIRGFERSNESGGGFNCFREVSVDCLLHWTSQFDDFGGVAACGFPPSGTISF